MISQNQKNQAEGLLDIVFNTFKENIIVYQTPQKTYIDIGGEDPEFNFNRNHDEDVTFVSQSGIFPATIEYVDQQDNQQRNFPTPDSTFVVPLGFVKVCVSGDEGRNLLRAAERVVFDDTNFKIVSDARPRGLFSRKYTDFWLQKIDE